MVATRRFSESSLSDRRVAVRDDAQRLAASMHVDDAELMAVRLRGGRPPADGITSLEAQCPCRGFPRSLLHRAESALLRRGPSEMRFTPASASCATVKFGPPANIDRLAHGRADLIMAISDAGANNIAPAFEGIQPRIATSMSAASRENFGAGGEYEIAGQGAPLPPPRHAPPRGRNHKWGWPDRRYGPDRAPRAPARRRRIVSVARQVSLAFPDRRRRNDRHRHFLAARSWPEADSAVLKTARPGEAGARRRQRLETEARISFAEPISQGFGMTKMPGLAQRAKQAALAM